MPERITQKLVRDAKPKSTAYDVRDNQDKGFILRVTPNGVKTFFLEYKRGIREKIDTAHPKKLEDARTTARKRRAKYDEDGQTHNERENKIKRAKSKQFTLRKFIDDSYEALAIAENKTGTEIIQILRNQFKFLIDSPIEEITQELVRNWRAEQVNSGIKPQTANRKVAILSGCLNTAVENKLIPHNPLIGMKRLKIEKGDRVRWLGQKHPKEEKHLRDALKARDDRLKAERERYNLWCKERGKSLFPDLNKVKYADYLEPMVLLAMNTGTRRGELFGLEWSAVNFNTKIMQITAQTAKTQKTRHIPLNKEAMDVLQEWKKQSSTENKLVFPNLHTGERLTNIKTSWNGILDKANIKDFHFHDLRHHFASRLVQNGVPLYTVKELLGHSSLEMTERYSHLAEEHKADAVAMLDED